MIQKIIDELKDGSLDKTCDKKVKTTLLTIIKVLGNLKDYQENEIKNAFTQGVMHNNQSLFGIKYYSELEQAMQASDDYLKRLIEFNAKQT